MYFEEIMMSSEFQKEFEIFDEYFIPFLYFSTLFIIFNPLQPKLTLFDLFDLKWPQITVYSCTNRFLSVFPFPPISESENIVSEWVFIDSRKKLTPKHSWFHGEKPTSGFEVPTGSRKVPNTIARVKLYKLPKFHPNRLTRIGGDNIFNGCFLISCLTSWLWGGVKIFVPSYSAYQTAGVYEISSKNMNRKFDFSSWSKSFGIPAYVLF